MNDERQAELEDLLYCIGLMYEQSKQAPDSSPIHPDRLEKIKKAVKGYYQDRK